MTMLIPFAPLMRTWRADPTMAAFADRHYSRRKPGAKQFAGNGSDIVLRDSRGEVLFVWLMQRFRADGKQFAFNCSKFRNESAMLSSELILCAESIVRSIWGSGVAFTYIDPLCVRSSNPGYCFKCAGWRFARVSCKGKHVLEKQL